MQYFLIKALGYLIILSIIVLAALLYLTMQPVSKQNLTIDYAVRANPDSLKEYVYHLSEELPPRSDDIANLDASADYIFRVLKQYSGDVSYQQFQIDGVAHKNVIARFGELSTECGTYVIGAHYDVQDGHPGADDNASGVAGILELARLFSNAEVLCPIELVAYTLEEINSGRKHMGSYYHAQSFANNETKLEWMLSLEMIGYFTDEANSQDYPLSVLSYVYPDIGNYIAIVGNLDQIGITRSIKAAFKGGTDLPVYSINTTTRINGITRSDHASYWSFGFPALMVTDTSWNRNRNYHTQYDTWETLDYQRMAKVVIGVYYVTLSHIDAKLN